MYNYTHSVLQWSLVIFVYVLCSIPRGQKGALERYQAKMKAFKKKAPTTSPKHPKNIIVKYTL